MIRLVVISDSPPTVTKYFNQPTVTIGSTPASADLALLGESLNDKHVQIIQEKHGFYAINCANDPFATINGKPFGKKILYANDIIQIGNAIMRFEIKPAAPNSFPPSPVAEGNHQRTNHQGISHPTGHLTSHELKNTQPPSHLIDTKEMLPIILEKKIIDHSAASPPFFPSVEETLIHDIPPPENDLFYDDALMAYQEEIAASSSDWSQNLADLEKEIFDQTIFEEEALHAYSEFASSSSQDPQEAPSPASSDASSFDTTEISLTSTPLTSAPLPSTPLPSTPLTSAPLTNISLTSISLTSPPISTPTRETTDPSQQTPHPLAETLATVSIPIAENQMSKNQTAKETTSSSLSATQAKLSLKDYYLSEYDDVGDLPPPPADDHSALLSKFFISVKNWVLYLKMMGVVLIFALVILVLAFLWMTAQSDKEEKIASKAVADVAMALTYAQIKNVYPKNQNCSDPEYIRHNLISVLPSKSPSYADFDTHGQFANCPYLLRIYTSADLSQFLVIAQPAPSLLQWLIPKSTITVDSHAMELRKTKDLKLLNRLLVNANTLEGESAQEVSHLVSQGTLIPLLNLDHPNENTGFAPPKALALLRPGAENFIYNAPRYFPLGEEIMKKSLDLLERPASNHEISQLQQELISISKIPHAILYTSGGIQDALHSSKALSLFLPSEKFLIAYLQINEEGSVANSHLLMDDTLRELSIADNFKPSLPQHAITHVPVDSTSDLNPSQERSLLEVQDPLLRRAQRSDIDEDNPLFLQLLSLTTFREQALRPISEEMASLLNKQAQSPQKNFDHAIKELLQHYVDIDTQQQAKIQRKLAVIYRENKHLPPSQLIHLADIAGLKEPLVDYLEHIQQLPPESEN